MFSNWPVLHQNDKSHEKSLGLYPVVQYRGIQYKCLNQQTASNFAVSLILRQTCSSAAVISPHCEEAHKAHDYHLSLPLISRIRRTLQGWVPYMSSARKYLLPDLDVGWDAWVREPPPLAYHLPTQSSREEMRPFPADRSDLFLNCVFAKR